MSQFCKRCNFWGKELFVRLNEKFGVCTEPIARNQMIQDTSEHLSENNVVYTAEYFGCIYFREKPLVLTKIEPKGE